MREVTFVKSVGLTPSIVPVNINCTVTEAALCFSMFINLNIKFAVGTSEGDHYSCHFFLLSQFMFLLLTIYDAMVAFLQYIRVISLRSYHHKNP